MNGELMQVVDIDTSLRQPSWRRSRVRHGVGRALDRVSAWDHSARTRWPVSAIVGAEIDRTNVPGDGSRLLVRPAVLGFIALCAIAAGCAQPASPFVLKLPHAWFFGTSPVANPNRGLLLGLVAVYGGLLLLMRVWFSLSRMLAQVPGVPVRKLALVFALWTIPMLLVPPLFSRDAYSYAAQGEMVSHHISPYLYGPHTLGDGNRYASLVDTIWENAPAPYGPLFLQVDGFLAQLSGHNELVTVLLLRLLALFGVGMLALGIPSLARGLGRDPSEAFALAVLNPVTMLHLVGGAHNDALMVGLLVLGLAVARRGRPVAGIVLCALAAAVKAPAALGVLYIGWQWMGPGLPVRERVRPLISAGLLAALVMGAISAMTGLGFGWIANLASPGTVTSWLAPATGVGILLSHAAHAVGLGVHRATILSLTRVTGLLGASVAGLWLLLRSDRIGLLRAMGLTLLAVTVLGPVVQPWYLSWGLILLAPVATGKARSVLIAVSIASAFIGLPAGRFLIQELFAQNPMWVAAALLACLFILTVPLAPVRVLRRDVGRGEVVSALRRLLGARGRRLEPALLDPLSFEQVGA